MAIFLTCVNRRSSHGSPPAADVPGVAPGLSLNKDIKYMSHLLYVTWGDFPIIRIV